MLKKLMVMVALSTLVMTVGGCGKAAPTAPAETKTATVKAQAGTVTITYKITTTASPVNGVYFTGSYNNNGVSVPFTSTSTTATYTVYNQYSGNQVRGVAATPAYTNGAMQFDISVNGVVKSHSGGKGASFCWVCNY